ncbi:MAG: glycosyltransferase family 4 protein [Fluviicola sp.]
MPDAAPHILIVSSWYPNEKNPFLGNFVQRHAQMLSKRYRITVINLICCESSEKNSVTIVQDESVTEIQARYPKGSKLARFGNRSRVYSDALKKLDAVDLIIGHVLLPHGWMFLHALRVLKCPLFWVEHGSYFRKDRRRLWSPRERLIRRSMVLRASEIIAVSDSLRSDMQRYISSERIKVIGNHVDEAKFTYQEKTGSDTTQFLHVSTLDRNTKNPVGVVDACELLKNEGASFHLTIVSDEDASEWTQYAKERQVHDVITFVGPQKWNDMPKFYHNADAFVLNSDYETFSIVLAEALSTGTPVVTTEVGIAPEIPASAKISVKKNTPESLKEGMKQVISGRSFKHDEIAQLGEKYHSTAILDEWTQLISKYVG